MSNFFSYFFI